MAHLGAVVFNRTLSLCTVVTDHKFPSVKFPVISRTSSARLAPLNSLVAPKKVSVGEGLPAH